MQDFTKWHLQTNWTSHVTALGVLSNSLEQCFIFPSLSSHPFLYYSSLKVSLTILIISRSFWTFLYAFCALPCIISHFYVSQEQEQVNFCCQKFFVLLRFGSVVHPCCYKLSKVLSLFNDNIYKVHIISYSKSYITSMIICTEGSELFFLKPKILRLSMTATPFLCVFIELMWPSLPLPRQSWCRFLLSIQS